MTIWRWEEFSRCDKFPTTPALHIFILYKQKTVQTDRGERKHKQKKVQMHRTIYNESN